MQEAGRASWLEDYRSGLADDSADRGESRGTVLKVERHAIVNPFTGSCRSGRELGAHCRTGC